MDVREESPMQSHDESFAKATIDSKASIRQKVPLPETNENNWEDSDIDYHLKIRVPRAIRQASGELSNPKIIDKALKGSEVEERSDEEEKDSTFRP